MIVSAAVKVYMYERDIDIILPVHHHKDARGIMSDLGFTDYDYRYGTEGFLTEKGEFLGRFDALCEAVECGQLSDLSDEQFEMVVASDKLMSEDLW